MIKKPLKNVQHQRGVAIDQRGVTPGGKFRQQAAEVLGIFHRSVEMDPPRDIAFNKLAVPIGQQLPEQGRAAQFPRRDIVLLNKARQLTVRIEQITMLVGAIHPAVLESGEQFQRRLRREISRAEHGDLTFEHFVKPADRQRFRVIKADQVVRMIQPVGPAVGLDGMVYPSQSELQEIEQAPPGERGFARGKPGIDTLPIFAAGATQVIHDALSLDIRNGSRQQSAMPLERLAYPLQKTGDFSGQGEGFTGSRAE